VIDFYGTAIAFRAYHLARGNVINLDVDDSEIETCLLVGSEWMDATFASYLTGTKTGERAQIREQPRISQFDRYEYSIASDVVPLEYEQAAYEVAYKHLATPGVLNADYTPTKYDSVSIDGAVSVVFTKFNSVSEIQTKFSRVMQLMSGLISTRSNVSSLSGSSIRT
jgi:hypothetical protein